MEKDASDIFPDPVRAKQLRRMRRKAERKRMLAAIDGLAARVERMEGLLEEIGRKLSALSRYSAHA